MTSKRFNWKGFAEGRVEDQKKSRKQIFVSASLAEFAVTFYTSQGSHCLRLKTRTRFINCSYDFSPGVEIL